MEISKFDKARIRRFRKWGWTYRDIASVIGVSHSTICRFLKKQSIWARMFYWLLNTFKS